MKRNRLFYFLIILTCLCITGCFEYEEKLTLNKNGSGNLHVHYKTREGVNIEDENNRFPSEPEEIRDEVEEKYTSKNVKLIDFEIEDYENWRHVDFTVKFKQVTDLNDLKQFTDSKIRIKKHGSGKFEFRRTLEVEGDYDDDDDDDSFLEKLARTALTDGLLNKIKFKFVVIAPRQIHKNNAHWVRDNKEALWRYTLTDLIKENRVNMTFECY